MTQEFLDAYMTALLWSGSDTGPDGSEVRFDECEVDVSVLEQSERDCRKFCAAAASLIPNRLMQQAGHDFALTRNRHGVGFWDRPEVYGQDAADRLTKLSEQAGEMELYLGDDGRVYC